MRRRVKLLVRMVLVMALAAGVTAAATSSASASGVTYVYVSLPTWAGNCPSGSSVNYLRVSSWSASTSDYRADWGDDLVYIRVGYRENTQIVAQGYCHYYWGPAVSWNIYATYQGQTWWMGPKGVWHN